MLDFINFSRVKCHNRLITVLFCNGFLVTSLMWVPGAFEKTKNTIFSHRSKHNERNGLLRICHQSFFYLLSPSTLPISRTFLSKIQQETFHNRLFLCCSQVSFYGNLKYIAKYLDKKQKCNFCPKALA